MVQLPKRRREGDAKGMKMDLGVARGKGDRDGDYCGTLSEFLKEVD